MRQSLTLLILTGCLSVLPGSVSVAAVAAPGSGVPGPGVPPVVSAEWLAGHLEDPALVILDARAGLRDYLAAHLPGAQSLGVENIRSSAAGVPGQIFPAEVLSIIARRLGIRPGSHVVVYGAETDPDATLVASVFRLAGLGAVSVLDGGFKRWSQESRPTTAERGPVSESGLRLKDPDAGLASLADVRRAVKEGGPVLVDARPAEQYEAGRIPGAVSRFWKDDLVPEGQDGAGGLRDAAGLEAEYRALGITKDRPVIVYCNTGHTASEVFYTLRYRLGYPDVRLYDGSWVEWSQNPDLPRDKGPARAPDR